MLKLQSAFCARMRYFARKTTFAGNERVLPVLRKVLNDRRIALLRQENMLFLFDEAMLRRE